jgi:hypothetical protein
MKTNQSWRLQITLATMTVAALSGCSGGGGGEDDDAPTPANPAEAAGLWKGSASVAGSSVPYVASALVTADGHARFYIQSTDTTVPPTLAPTVVEGNLIDSGGTLALSAATFYSLLTPKTGSVTGRFDGAARSNATGTLTFGSKTYNVDLTYDSQYDRASSLPAIAGVYTRSNAAGYTITVTINADGTLTGSDTLSCMYSGTVAADLPTVNAYDLTWNGTGCTNSNRNGAFTGRLALIDSPNVAGVKALLWYAHSATDPLLLQLPEK